MLATRSARFEYEVEAALQHVYRRNNAVASYEPIVGSGANACVLHYRANNAPIKKGDLLLCDAGAEYGFYASDITRTWPTNGRFSKPQRELYDIVLAAQHAQYWRSRASARPTTRSTRPRLQVVHRWPAVARPAERHA